ncbi:MAG: DUF2173 family protein [Aquificaceae bacterium]|nr:DUF2173 family protein [Aquificaceae bacterium]MDW8097106.1 DUF2173 family protein [Aquificaceae bacterium]
MANLERLLNIKGVWAAGQFNPDGTLVDCKGELSQEFALMAARMCSANNHLASLMCDTFSGISEQEWTPARCWSVSGPKYGIFVVGNVGVMFNTKEVSLNEIFRALSEEAKV